MRPYPTQKIIVISKEKTENILFCDKISRYVKGITPASEKDQIGILIFFFSYFYTLFNNSSENRSIIGIRKNKTHAITHRHTNRQISKIK